MSNFEVEEIDSDGDFPDDCSDSDVSESDFHDAVDQRPLKVLKASTMPLNDLATSNLNRSTFGLV